MQSWAKIVSLSNTRDFRHVCVSLHSKLWSEKINDKPIGLFIIMVFENNRMVLAREGLARCACPDALRISGVHSLCAAVYIHLEHSLFFSSQIDSSLRLISSRSYPATLLLTMHYGEVEKHNDVIHPWQSIGRSRKQWKGDDVWSTYMMMMMMMIMTIMMTIMMTTVMVMIEYGRSVLALMTEVCGLPGCYACGATIWFSFRSMRKLWRLWFWWKLNVNW